MNKKHLVEKLLTDLSKRAEKLKASLERTCQSAIDAPGAMQSKSDTTKSEMSRLADNIFSLLQQIQRCTAAIKEIDFSKDYKEVQVGVLVKVEEDKNKTYYFILPSDCGGQGIEFKGQEVNAIGVKSPIAQALLGKKVGNAVKIKVPAGARTLNITKIE